MNMNNKKHELFLLTMIAVFLLAFASPSKAGEVFVNVSITSQQAVVNLPNGSSFSTRVSTGKRGYSTPKGNFTVYRRHRMWHSRKYDMTPMPYSLFFRGGYALHTGDTRRGFASHGCVRLPNKAAKRLFRSSKGHTVKVIIR